MYEKFESSYKRDSFLDLPTGNSEIYIDKINNIHGWNELFLQFSGASFNSGLYRILKLEEINDWSDRIVTAFPDYKERVLPFAFDWLNRIYCIDFHRTQDSQPLILLFSHITDEVLQVPGSLVEFHNEILINSGRESLDIDLFEAFLTENKIKQLNRSECIEITHPLFLGGDYLLSNMGIQDSSVDWEINSQLLIQARHLEEGAVINKMVLNSGKKSVSSNIMEFLKKLLNRST